MIICCATDKNYAEFSSVLFHSIEENGDAPDLQFWIIGDNLGPREKKDIQHGIKRNINFIDADKELKNKILKLPMHGPWPSLIYARLFLPEMFADKTDKILYLDADIIVKKSLKPLIELEMGEKALAAVAEPGREEVTRRLGLRTGSPIFNSGVLLFDVANWNRLGLTQKAIGAVTSGAINMRCPDQDALIIASQDHLLKLPAEYNAGKNFTDYSTASIVHFTHKKPNRRGCKHPETAAYLKHRSQTAWGDRPLMTPIQLKIQKWRKSIDKRLNKLRILFKPSQ
ncbi:glycosyltransferase family 8 protein [Rhizobium sp. PAMB 3182]